MNKELLNLAKQVGELYKQKGLSMVTAESCTGGQIAYLLTSVAGSSEWYERGFVTYSNLAKHENLGVPLQCIEQFGAVSEETAKAMAVGALKNSEADVSVISTGIAGPTGGSKEKPVGTVWLGWCKKGFEPEVKSFLFANSDRLQIRAQACHEALHGLMVLI